VVQYTKTPADYPAVPLCDDLEFFPIITTAASCNFARLRRYRVDPELIADLFVTGPRLGSLATVVGRLLLFAGVGV